MTEKERSSSFARLIRPPLQVYGLFLPRSGDKASIRAHVSPSMPRSLDELLALAAKSEDEQDLGAAEEYFNNAIAIVDKSSTSADHVRAYRLFAAFLRRRGHEQQAAALDKIAEIHDKRQDRN